MDFQKLVLEKLLSLSQDKQQEVLDFIEFLSRKNYDIHPRDPNWSEFSLSNALKDMLEDTPPYSASDIRIQY